MRFRKPGLWVLVSIFVSLGCGLLRVSTDEMESGIKKGLNEELQQRGVEPRVTAVTLVCESSHACTGLVTFDKGEKASVTVKTDGQKYIWEVSQDQLQGVLFQRLLTDAAKAMSAPVTPAAPAPSQAAPPTADQAAVREFTPRQLGGVTTMPALLASGWRYPTESDYSGGWETFRKDMPVPFHATGDFDGDGVTDDAWILLKSNGQGWGLFAVLHSASERSRIFQLDENGRDLPPQSMGISAQAGGELHTACGKGYWECKPGEPAVLQLQNVGVAYFAFESASSVFYWDGSSHFTRVWLSD